MRKHQELPDAFYDSLHDGLGSTRLEQAEDWLVAVFHDVLFDFDFDRSRRLDARPLRRGRLRCSARGLRSAPFH